MKNRERVILYSDMINIVSEMIDKYEKDAKSIEKLKRIINLQLEILPTTACIKELEKDMAVECGLNEINVMVRTKHGDISLEDLIDREVKRAISLGFNVKD